jgi:hypothetical protein
MSNSQKEQEGRRAPKCVKDSQGYRYTYMSCPHRLSIVASTCLMWPDTLPVGWAGDMGSWGGYPDYELDVQNIDRFDADVFLLLICEYAEYK